jgi:ketosteroid isomerase-like protein
VIPHIGSDETRNCDSPTALTGARDTGAMSRENVELVRRLAEAINGWDIDGVAALLHPEFEAYVPPEFSAEPDTYRGRDGIRRYFDSFEVAMDEIRYHPEEIWDAGDSVVVAVQLTARGRQTSIPVEQRFAHLWAFRDGMAIGVRTYASASEALEAAGLPAE